MKKFFLRLLLCFLLPVLIAVIVDVFILPIDFFSFRCWEALWIESNRDSFRGGYYYPNMDLERPELGELAPHTTFAVRKQAHWLTDRYGYRKRDTGRERYDVVMVGDSFTAGATLTQDDMMSELVEKRTGLSVYPFAPSRDMNDFAAESRFILHRPSVVIVEKIERFIITEKLPHLQPVAPGNPPDKELLNHRWYERLLILQDRFNKQMMFRYLKQRVFNFKDRPMGKSYPSNPGEFFMNGEEAKMDITDQELEDLVNKVQQYKAYLNSLGIRFIFIPIPDKESVYCGMLPSKRHPVVIDKIIDRLRSTDIEVVDVLHPLREKYLREGLRTYHTDDSHWNPTGARIAAELLSEQLLNPPRKKTRP